MSVYLGEKKKKRIGVHDTPFGSVSDSTNFQRKMWLKDKKHRLTSSLGAKVHSTVQEGGPKMHRRALTVVKNPLLTHGQPMRFDKIVFIRVQDF